MLCLILSFKPLEKKPIAPAPVLGYNTWNAFRGDINEEKVKRTADLMVEKGLRDAGYEYIIIDDGYLLKDRDADGKIIIDTAKFPSGMKALGDYVHSKGLKFGMYNCAGTYTCMGLAGSFGHEKTDAETFKEFGVDFLKYDFCYNPIDESYYAPDLFSIVVNGIKYTGAQASLIGVARLGSEDQITYIGNKEGEAEFLVNVPATDFYIVEMNYVSGDGYRVMEYQINNDESQIFLAEQTTGFAAKDVKTFSIKVKLQKGANTIRFFMDLNAQELDQYSYQRMSDELILSHRDIVFAVCEWGTHQPYIWAKNVGHMWRTSLDITAITDHCDWPDIVTNYDTTISLYEYAGENGYNDPDMLCVGLSGINYNENLAHISLWAITASPLLIGANLETIDQKYVDMLRHKDMLAINQDKMYKQGIPVEHTQEYDILVKEMTEDRVAICLFNRLNGEQELEIDLAEVYKYLENQAVWENAKAFSGKEIWTGAIVSKNSADSLLKLKVPAHGAGLFIVKPE